MPKMPKFRVIEGGAAPAVKRKRAPRQKNLPQCHKCHGRETVQASIGNVRNRLCVACLMKGERVVVE